jgi:hypothetical protein
MVPVSTALALLAISFVPGRSSAETRNTSPVVFTKAESTGTVSVIPNTAKPSDCLRAAKEVCTFEVRGSETNTAYDGPGELGEHITIDFSRPESSGAGICFPQMVVGTMHTAAGDYNFYSQGENCIPPKSSGVAPGFGNLILHVVIIGGTGRFEHAVGTLMATAVSHPPAPTLYHTSGAIIGIQPAR